MARLTALPRSGARSCRRSRSCAAQQGLKLKELHLESGRLDEVFRTITAVTAKQTQPCATWASSCAASLRVISRRRSRTSSSSSSWCWRAPSRSTSAASTSAARPTWTPFFTFHPWLYLFLVPAISMRLWAEERKSGTHRAAADAAGDAVAGGARQIPRGMAVHRARARADLPDLDHRQLPRQPGQRRDLRRLPRQPAAGGRLPRDRLVHVGADPQPGRRLHPRGGRVLRVPARRLPAGARPVPRWAAAGARRRGRLAVVPHALRVHRQGRHRPARPAVLRDADRASSCSRPPSLSSCAKRT